VGHPPVSYVYNSLGQRVEKKVGSVYTEYVFGAFGELVATHDRTTWTRHYAPPLFGPLGVYEDGLTRFIHKNHLGSSTFLTDNMGAVTQKTLYYPFGRSWATGGTVKDDRFASLQQRDAETTGWQDPLDPTPNRTYTSGLGRWLSPDPLGGDVTNPQSLNRYAYVLNSPCSYTDPLGLNPCSFNIAINNSGLINQSQVNTLEQTLKAIFATAGVGVNFNFSGKPDYSLDVSDSIAANTYFPPSAPPQDALGVTPAFAGGNVIANYGFAFVDRLLISGYSSPNSLAVALGEVGAHEAGHYLLHIGDSPQNIGIMAQSLNGQYGWPGFSYGNSIQLQDKCKKLRPPGGRPAHPGGGGPGGGGGRQGTGPLFGGGVAGFAIGGVTDQSVAVVCSSIDGKPVHCEFK
jgi:RHS repeat-associated protein